MGKRNRKEEQQAVKIRPEEAVLLDAIPSATVITTLEGDILYFNQATMETLGYGSRAEFVETNANHYWADPKDRERFVQQVKKGEGNRFEARLNRKDGTIFWGGIAASLKEIQGQTLIFSSYLDITDKKGAEELAEYSEEKYRILFEESQQAIWLVDKEKRKIIDFNTRAYESLGYTREEFAALDIRDIDPFIAPEEMNRHEKRMDENVGGMFESQHRTKQGDIRDVVIDIKRVSTHGKVLSQVFCYDITEFKAMEKSLRESEEQYRFLAENIDDVIWGIDLEMNLIYLSPSVEKLTGYTVEEYMNMGAGKWFIPTSLQEARENIQNDLDQYEIGQSRDHFRRHELELHCKDGSTVWVESLSRFSFDESGNPSGRIGAARDITERRKMTAELKNYRDHLEKLIKRRTAELGEVNTTLRVLLEEINQEKSKLKGEILFNIKQMVIPYIKKLKKTELIKKQINFLNIIESNLMDIVLPIAHNMPLKDAGFSGKEIQVANFIIQGLSTREIADQLSLSIKTIEFHRNNIRRKLGISNKKINLKTFLSSYKS